MSIEPESAQASLAQAKASLLDAARALDPLALIRRRPLTSMAVAAGIVTVLGTNRGRQLVRAGLGRAISSSLWLGVFAVGKHLMAGASHTETKICKEPARTPART